MVFASNNQKETENIAIAFAKKLTHGDVVCLNGELGAGKTAFVQGIAKGLGIDEYISSPTFTIVNCYDGKDFPLYHFDVYRICDCEEMFEIGYEEYIYSNGVSVIEWSEIIKEILPCKFYDVYIKKDLNIHENYREISIEKRCINEDISN